MTPLDVESMIRLARDGLTGEECRTNDNPNGRVMVYMPPLLVGSECDPLLMSMGAHFVIGEHPVKEVRYFMRVKSNTALNGKLIRVDLKDVTND